MELIFTQYKSVLQYHGTNFDRVIAKSLKQNEAVHGVYTISKCASVHKSLCS